MFFPPRHPPFPASGIALLTTVWVKHSGHVLTSSSTKRLLSLLTWDWDRLATLFVLRIPRVSWRCPDIATAGPEGARENPHPQACSLHHHPPPGREGSPRLTTFSLHTRNRSRSKTPIASEQGCPNIVRPSIAIEQRCQNIDRTSIATEQRC